MAIFDDSWLEFGSLVRFFGMIFPLSQFLPLVSCCCFCCHVVITRVSLFCLFTLSLLCLLPPEKLDEMLAGGQSQEVVLRGRPSDDFRAATVKQRPTSRRITQAEINVRRVLNGHACGPIMRLTVVVWLPTWRS